MIRISSVDISTRAKFSPSKPQLQVLSVISTFFLEMLYKLCHLICSLLCLTSLTVFLKFIHAMRCFSNSVFHWYYSIVWIYHILFIHLPLDEHLGCIHFLAVMNNAALNTVVHIFVWTYVCCSIDPYLGVEILGHMIVFNFLRNCSLIFYFFPEKFFPLFENSGQWFWG